MSIESRAGTRVFFVSSVWIERSACHDDAKDTKKPWPRIAYFCFGFTNFGG